MLGELSGKTFLDVGCGSGIQSLAAHRLGAKVVSFDYDFEAVAVAMELKARFAPDADWEIMRGDALDRSFIDSLGVFEVVYSWGGLHHTGAMWEGLDNVVRAVGPSGRLFVALYNDQGRASRVWRGVKRTYNQLPSFLRFMILIPAFVRLWGPTVIRDFVRGQPMRTWRSYAERGMSAWRDFIDWVGGYPYEVARPRRVIEYCLERGLRLERQNLTEGLGCNEFLFSSSPARTRRTEAL